LFSQQNQQLAFINAVRMQDLGLCSNPTASANIFLVLLCLEIPLTQDRSPLVLGRLAAGESWTATALEARNGFERSQLKLPQHKAAESASSKRLKITGLENPVLFALQNSNRIDRLSQPRMALEICNFLSLCSLGYSRSEKSS
jgi:hypothetical protein